MFVTLVPWGTLIKVCSPPLFGSAISPFIVMEVSCLMSTSLLVPSKGKLPIDPPLRILFIYTKFLCDFCFMLGAARAARVYSLFGAPVVE